MDATVAAVDAPEEPPPFWSSAGLLIREPWRMIRRGGAPLLAFLVGFNALILLLVTPLIGWLFKEALRAAGMVAVDLQSIHMGKGLTITVALLVVIGLLAGWAVSMQMLLIYLALHRIDAGLPVTLGSLAKELRGAAVKLARPSAIPLFIYLLVILPLTGFGFTTVLARTVAIPPFITGELMKTPLTALLVQAFFVALFYLNLRFSLALPIFAFTSASGSEALKESWKYTRWRALLLLVVGATGILFLATVATALFLGAAILPTFLADEFAPGAAPTVAAISLSIGQVGGLVIAALVTTALAGMSVTLLKLQAPGLVTPPSDGASPLASDKRVRRQSAWLVAGILAAGTAGLAVTWAPAMHELAKHPVTLVIGHRGFTEGGVENSIGALEAAHAAGADLVEMDVMQTKDGRFIVMHDANLKRLADQDIHVKDLTLEELTQITISGPGGHTDLIPSLADYVTRADELGMMLLIEIKLGGADTEDHVARLVEELEELGVLEKNMYHTLDKASAETLKSLRPDLTVGYILPLAGAGVPDTPADFLVVEEQSASTSMHAATDAAGKFYVVWTVNSPEQQRALMRQQIDALITDHPDKALSSRSEMATETGMLDVLVDLLDSFVIVF